jgi:hypothetical protein
MRSMLSKDCSARKIIALLQGLLLIFFLELKKVVYQILRGNIGLCSLKSKGKIVVPIPD